MAKMDEMEMRSEQLGSPKSLNSVIFGLYSPNTTYIGLYNGSIWILENRIETILVRVLGPCSVFVPCACMEPTWTDPLGVCSRFDGPFHVWMSSSTLTRLFFPSYTMRNPVHFPYDLQKSIGIPKLPLFPDLPHTHSWGCRAPG